MIMKHFNSSLHTAMDRDKIKDQALKLALQCLSFDFIGITPDESAEDLGIVQIPATWRSIFEDSGTLALFLELYRTSSPPQSTQVHQK
jgi:exportin-7